MFWQLSCLWHKSCLCLAISPVHLLCKCVWFVHTSCKHRGKHLAHNATCSYPNIRACDTVTPDTWHGAMTSNSHEWELHIFSYYSHTYFLSYDLTICLVNEEGSSTWLKVKGCSLTCCFKVTWRPLEDLPAHWMLAAAYRSGVSSFQWQLLVGEDWFWKLGRGRSLSPTMYRSISRASVSQSERVESEPLSRLERDDVHRCAPVNRFFQSSALPSPSSLCCIQPGEIYLAALSIGLMWCRCSEADFFPPCSASGLF